MLSFVSNQVSRCSVLRDHFLTARARFYEGLSGDLDNQVVEQLSEEHPERYLLAFFFGYLGDHDLLGVRTDAEKFPLLAVLNLAECIAFVGAPTSSG